jgi:type 1 glutamine amidotransferase
MRILRLLAIAGLAIIAFSFFVPQDAPAQAPQAKKKRILAIGATQGFQHDSISDAMYMMTKLGKDTGLWDTVVKTDTELITKKKLEGNRKNLDTFDAIFLYTTGELPLDDEQKQALLSFVKDDGKGIIGGHSAIDTFYKWPEFGEMMGGYFDLHPWNQFDAPVIVEDREHPITKHMPATFTIKDEIYQVKDYSRDKVRVLARLDEKKIDLANKGVHRKDGDFAVAWVKNYGQGRVFWTTFGHREEVYDNKDIQKMYLEATKWVLKLTDGPATPRPKPMGD